MSRCHRGACFEYVQWHRKRPAGLRLPFFELIRLDILFKFAKQVLHLVCKQTGQIPERCSPVYLLGKGFHVHFVHSRITLLLQSQPFALGLCLADFLGIFFSDGQFLLLESTIFLQIVTHGFRLFPVHVRFRFFRDAVFEARAFQVHPVAPG